MSWLKNVAVGAFVCVRKVFASLILVGWFLFIVAVSCVSYPPSIVRIIGIVLDHVAWVLHYKVFRPLKRWLQEQEWTEFYWKDEMTSFTDWVKNLSVFQAIERWHEGPWFELKE